MRTARAAERGSVLVVVVLLSVGMFAVAHGLLRSAQAILTTARLGAGLVEGVAVSDGAITGFVRRGPPPGAGLLSEGEASNVLDSAGAVRIEATWRRVGRETWLLSARAPIRAGTVVATGSRLVWWPDPVTRLHALPATVSVGPDAGGVASGTIRNRTLAEERAEASPALADACESIWSAWASGTVGGTTAADPTAAVGTLVVPSLGAFGVEQLIDRARLLPGDHGSAAANTLGGSCAVDDPWNWGDPERPASPCANHYGLVASRATLRVEGGAGQGVLVVDGDLVLAADTRFHGLVVATGTVRLVDTAVLTGFAIAGAGLDTSDDARVVRSVCRAGRALDGVRRALGAKALHPALDFIPR